MKASKTCWGGVLIGVNIVIATLALLQMGIAVEFQNTVNSSNVLKHERKWGTIMVISTGLMSFIVAFYGAFVSILYVSSFILGYAWLLIFSIVIQATVCIIAFYNFKIFDKIMFIKDPKMLIKNNEPSEGLIFLQKHLRCCGFEGMQEYTNLPKSCCRNSNDCRKGALDVYRTGCRDAMENYIEFFGITIAVVLLHHIAVDIVGIIGAFCQRRFIKKEIDEKRKMCLRNYEEFFRPKRYKKERGMYSIPQKKRFLFKKRGKRADQDLDKGLGVEEGRASNDTRNQSYSSKRNDSKMNQYNVLHKSASEEWIDDPRDDIKAKEDTKTKQNVDISKRSFSLGGTDSFSVIDFTQIDPTAVLGKCDVDQTKEENVKGRCASKKKISKTERGNQSDTGKTQELKERVLNTREENKTMHRRESSRSPSKRNRNNAIENVGHENEEKRNRSSSSTSRVQLHTNSVEKLKSSSTISPKRSQRKSVVFNETKEEVSHKGSFQKSPKKTEELSSKEILKDSESKMSLRNSPRTSYEMSDRSRKKSSSPDLKSPTVGSESSSGRTSGTPPSRSSEYRPSIISIEQFRSSLVKQPSVQSGNSLLSSNANKGVEKSRSSSVDVQSTSNSESVRKSNRSSSITYTSPDSGKGNANISSRNMSKKLPNPNLPMSRNASLDYRASVEKSPRSNVDWSSTQNSGFISAEVEKQNRASVSAASSRISKSSLNSVESKPSLVTNRKTTITKSTPIPGVASNFNTFVDPIGKASIQVLSNKSAQTSRGSGKRSVKFSQEFAVTKKN